MTDTVSFNIQGIDELNKKLESVSNDLKYKGGRFALRKAANLVAKKAKDAALRIDDQDTGRKIADNVAIRWSGRRFKRTGDLMFRVGVLTGSIRGMLPGNPDTGPKGATPHAMLVELGTERIRAQPYLRPALADNVAAAIDEFVAQYNKSLDRAAKKAAK